MNYKNLYLIVFYINIMIGRQLKEKKGSKKSVSKKSVSKKSVSKKGSKRSVSKKGSKRSVSKKGSKNILPKISGNVHLSDYGYTLKNKEKSRKTSLKRASKEEGTLTTLRHLNLIRNYTKSVPKNYKKLSKDVEFLKKEYAKEKRSKGSK